jgi:hypothetical protein
MGCWCSFRWKSSTDLARRTFHESSAIRPEPIAFLAVLGGSRCLHRYSEFLQTSVSLINGGRVGGLNPRPASVGMSCRPWQDAARIARVLARLYTPSPDGCHHRECYVADNSGTPRESASMTHDATLADDERRKVRELFAACSPESVGLALSILDTLDATTADWEAVCDREVLTSLVESWNPEMWNDLHRRLPSRRKDLFAALVVTRFVTTSHHRWALEEKFEAVWHWACEWMWMWWAELHPDRGDLRTLIRMQSSGPRWVFQQDFPWVTLGFLTHLDDDIIDAITGFRGDVHLEGITRLTVEQARGLARHQGWLYCNSITDIPEDVAEELVKHPSHVFLEGLTTLSHVGLAKKLASKPSVYLDNVVSCSEGAAGALAQSNARVFARHISDRLATSDE